ncbi:hypothetical protein FQR65_LT03791, partial [Abscondita terminalis]
MSLYDDVDVKTRPTDNVSGWSSGIKLLQSQLQLKRATVTQPKRDQTRKAIPSIPSFSSEYDWNVDNEYDPLWPNEYEKIVKELRDNQPVVKPARAGGGVAIAPPPSLQEPPEVVVPALSKLQANTYDGSSVAAKIMAKYGFKEGQGLGKQEQGMSMALQVEKTSKRGGRIIHEKEIIIPPAPNNEVKSEQTITEIMKTPGKVVLLRNMVGPGEVDDELEPEVKDECNTKYGEVATVTIHEVPNVEPEDSVRIFVEFRRIESAIKAVVDLNGRFFGGRQVKATFYDADKFYNFQL